MMKGVEGHRGALRGFEVELLDMYPSVKIVARALGTIGSGEDEVIISQACTCAFLQLG